MSALAMIYCDTHELNNRAILAWFEDGSIDAGHAPGPSPRTLPRPALRAGAGQASATLSAGS